MLFEGSGHTIAQLLDAVNADRPLHHFSLAVKVRSHLGMTRSQVQSENVVGLLPGSDPALKNEFVILSAHLDHYGIGAPVNGDKIYNGAMDDASGVASVLDIAHRLKQGPPPRRSVLFLLFTAEEKGLLGSSYYAKRPTVPKKDIVADLNFDMPLPLWPLKTVYAPGQDESSLADAARTVPTGKGLTMVPDPLPDRNVFIRTDQFSFVRE